MVPSLECDRASGWIYCNESISAVHPKTLEWTEPGGRRRHRTFAG